MPRAAGTTAREGRDALGNVLAEMRIGASGGREVLATHMISGTNISWSPPRMLWPGSKHTVSLAL